jgi:hypothetical protein
MPLAVDFALIIALLSFALFHCSMPSRPHKKQRSAIGGDVVVRRALAWLNSYQAVSKWMHRYKILRLIEQQRVAIIDNFLPGHVAEGALRILEDIDAGQWRDTSADDETARAQPTA